MHELTTRVLISICYLELLVFGLGILKKPEWHKPVGKDIVDKYPYYLL